MNYLDVKRAKKERNVRKRSDIKFILKKVEEMKRSIASDVMPEAVTVEPFQWTERNIVGCGQYTVVNN